MPLKNHDQLVAELKEANLRLAESLKRCKAIVADCRGKLTVKDGGRRSAFGWKGDERPANAPDKKLSEG